MVGELRKPELLGHVSGFMFNQYFSVSNFNCCKCKELMLFQIFHKFIDAGWISQTFIIIYCMCFIVLLQLPENDALAGLCGGMIAAWEAYGCPKWVLFIFWFINFFIYYFFSNHISSYRWSTVIFDNKSNLFL